MDQKLPISESLIEAILENVPVPMMLSDRSRTVLYVNPQFTEAFGYTIEDIPTETEWWSLAYPDPDYRQQVLQQWHKAVEESAMAGRKTALFDCRITCKDGSIHTVAPSRVSIGEQVLVILHDLTERKQAEESLRESQESYRVLFEQAGDLIFVLDPTPSAGPVILDVNRSACLAHGFTREEMIGKPIAELDDEENRGEVPERVRRILTGEPQIFESVHYRKDGSKFPVEVCAKWIERTGKSPVIFASERDLTRSKKAEASLREKEERFRTLVETQGEGVGIVNLQEQFAFANPAAERIFGVSPGQLIGRALKEFMSDKEFAYIQEQTALHLAGQFSTYDTEILAEDGEKRHLLVTATPQFDADGQFVGTLGIFRDITDRKQAEEALKSSLSLLNASLESTADGILIVDRKGRIVRWNRKFAELWKMPEEALSSLDDHQAINYILTQLVNPEQFVSSVRKLYERPEESSVDQIEFLDGRVFERYSQPQRIEDQVVGRVWSFRDVTKRTRAEAALRESEEKYRAIAETSQEWIWQVDMEGIHTYVNPAAEKILGYSLEELLGKKASIYIHPEDQQKVEEILPSCLTNRKGWNHLVLRWLHKDGSIRWLESNAVVMSDAQGELIGFQGADRDITEQIRGQAEKEQLEAVNRQLQKSQSLGRMAGAIAHHFNNQLQAVTGNLEMAKAELTLAGGPMEFLTNAMEAALRAAEISGLMLTYLGQTIGKRGPLDLSQVCRHCMPMLKVAMPKNITLVSDFPSPGPTVRGNTNQIKQVLTHLFTNAWEASVNAPAEIRLAVRTALPSEITAVRQYPISWQRKYASYACLEVADTGCGIDVEDIDNLFDPFFSRKFTGRGMGLPVVLGIVQSHGGVVTVESEPGKGSLFRVYFPITEEEVPHRLETKAVIPGDNLPAASSWSGTVLLVDDEDMVRTISSVLLKNLGFTVVEARDGLEAVEAFRHRADEIRFVLCDLTMPRMDGWQTIEALRQIMPGIPVVLASGYDENRVMSGKHDHQPQAFLNKPYQLKELIGTIDMILGGKQNAEL